MSLIDPMPIEMKRDQQLQGAIDWVAANAQPGDFMPVDASLLQQTLVLGIRWSHGSDSDRLFAKTLVPIMAAAAAALDALLHTLNAFAKTIAILPKASNWAFQTGGPKDRLVIQLGESLQHLVKAVGSVGMIAVAPLVAIASPEKALQLSDLLCITGGITFITEQIKINPTGLVDGWKIAKGPLKKLAFAVTEVSLNCSWRPVAWTVSLIARQATSHPTIATIIAVTGFYFGAEAAGYGPQVNQALQTTKTTLEMWWTEGSEMLRKLKNQLKNNDQSQ